MWGIIINHDISIPRKQPVFNGKYLIFFFVAQLKTQRLQKHRCSITSPLKLATVDGLTIHGVFGTTDVRVWHNYWCLLRNHKLGFCLCFFFKLKLKSRVNSAISAYCSRRPIRFARDLARPWP